jgi:hypothetical protein
VNHVNCCLLCSLSACIDFSYDNLCFRTCKLQQVVSELRSSKIEELRRNSQEEAEAWKFIFFVAALGKKLQGPGAGQEANRARRRWAIGKGGAPELHTQDTDALFNETLLCFERERREEASAHLSGCKERQPPPILPRGFSLCISC